MSKKKYYQEENWEKISCSALRGEEPRRENRESCENHGRYRRCKHVREELDESQSLGKPEKAVRPVGEGLRNVGVRRPAARSIRQSMIGVSVRRVKNAVVAMVACVPSPSFFM